MRLFFDGFESAPVCPDLARHGLSHVQRCTAFDGADLFSGLWIILRQFDQRMDMHRTDRDNQQAMVLFFKTFHQSSAELMTKMFWNHDGLGYMGFGVCVELDVLTGWRRIAMIAAAVDAMVAGAKATWVAGQP